MGKRRPCGTTSYKKTNQQTNKSHVYIYQDGTLSQKRTKCGLIHNSITKFGVSLINQWIVAFTPTRKAYVLVLWK
jgi:hypothetical protein